MHIPVDIVNSTQLLYSIEAITGSRRKVNLLEIEMRFCTTIVSLGAKFLIRIGWSNFELNGSI